MATWLKCTGAVGVATNCRDHKTSTGGFDALIGFYTGAMGIQLFEVAPYVTWLTSGPVPRRGAVNKRFFDHLPRRCKSLPGRRHHYNKVLAALSAPRRQAAVAMKKAGATFIPFSDDKRAEWANKMPNVAMDWARPGDSGACPARWWSRPIWTPCGPRGSLGPELGQG